MIFIGQEKCFLLLVGIFDDLHVSLLTKPWILPQKLLIILLHVFRFGRSYILFARIHPTLSPLHGYSKM